MTARLAALAGMLTLVTGATAGPHEPFVPLRFTAERVRITPADSSAWVAGAYTFEASAPMRAPILFPLPEASGEGAVDSLGATLTHGDGRAEPLLGTRDSAGWHLVLPIRRPGRCVLAVSYRQAHHGWLRYILTSTAAWGRALDSVEFVVESRGAPWEANVPAFAGDLPRGRHVLCWTAHDVLPRADLILVRRAPGSRRAVPATFASPPAGVD